MCHNKRKKTETESGLFDHKFFSREYMSKQEIAVIFSLHLETTDTRLFGPIFI